MEARAPDRRSCPECGTDAQGDEPFCERCGARLDSAGPPPTCWNCGSTLPLGSSGYCRQCGVPVSKGARPVAPPPASSPPTSSRLTERELARAGLRPRRRWNRGAVLVALLAAGVVVLAGLLLTGEGDRLLGRSYYSGSNPPPTNVTVFAVNVTETVTYTASQTYFTSSQTIFPARAPLFNVGGGEIVVQVPFIDQVANTTMTVESAGGSPGFTLNSVAPTLPISMAAGVLTWVTFTIGIAADPGFYVVHLSVSSTIT